MIHLGGRLECGRYGRRSPGASAASRCAARKRHGAEVGQVFHDVFRILDGEQIIVAALGIDPIARRDHPVGGQRGDEAVHHFLCAQAQFAGALAVNVNLQRRIIHVLRHQHVADARQGARLLGDLGGDVVRRLHIHAADLDVQRRGHALVEDGIHQAAGLEIGADLRQFAAAAARAPGSCIQSCSSDGRR